MAEDSDHPFPDAARAAPITAVGQKATTSGSNDAVSSVTQREDLVAVEEPLEVRVLVEADGERVCHRVAVTMRTPGHDSELACGFLLAEGVVGRRHDVWRVAHCEEFRQNRGNILDVHLAPGVGYDPDRYRRNGYTSSSCGVCGKQSIEQLRAMGGRAPVGEFLIESSAMHDMPAALRSAQSAFASTGGLHACGLFSSSGALELVREDVGRHNAVDKVIGRLLLDGRVPASSMLLLVSGRASFELVHKTMAAGISTLLAVGAPSSLAVDTARAFGMTLVGFLRDGRFNIYCGGGRIATGSPPTRQRRQS